MARAAGCLYIAGALIGFFSLLLPHARDFGVSQIATACAISIAAGVFLMFERGRLPKWAFPVSCFGSSILVAIAVYYSGRADSAYAFYFVLVAMFVAYFLSLNQLIA